jgi:C1A family cysteine protease
MNEVERAPIGRYGWIPDLPDFKDGLKVYVNLETALEMLPLKVDLRPHCGPIVNQGALGSCTANAIASAHYFNQKKEFLARRVTDSYAINPVIFYPSRLFIYYNEREMEGTITSDSGAMIRDGIKTVAQLGACPESSWPYKPHSFRSRPFQGAYDEAVKHQITAYQRLNSLQECQRCLADGYPFVFGFSVYESFESLNVAQTGIVPVPTMNERQLGGHAVMAVGYDDENQWLIVMNSWGASWGDKGFFYLPYEYITNNNLSDDFWTIRQVTL